ncbi:MAG: hypothetical protein JWR02_2324, partial [Mucilaginibacter sp.]|nr:hypothetical protein [Mucilaginibacter sp.]
MIQKIIKKIKFELQFNNPHYYTRVSQKIVKTAYQALLHKKLDKLSPITLQKENARLTLSILANKKRFYESIASLYSFCFWKRDIYIHYHEDGTLTIKEIDLLKKIFPGIKIFIRSENNLKVQNYLSSKGLHNCAKLRGYYLFSIKLFDMIIEKRTPYMLHIDSDVLFFSKPNEILDIIETGSFNGCYNLDVGNVYTFDDDTMSQYIPTPILNRFNSGILLHNFDESFFNFADLVMDNKPQAVTSWVIEQTLFAMYATLKGNFLALPKYYDLARKERALGNKLVSEHYVHNTGYDMHKDFIYKLYPIF